MRSLFWKMTAVMMGVFSIGAITDSYVVMEWGATRGNCAVCATLLACISGVAWFLSEAQP